MFDPAEINFEFPIFAFAPISIYNSIFTLIPIWGPLQKWKIAYGWTMVRKVAYVVVFYASVNRLDTVIIAGSPEPAQ